MQWYVVWSFGYLCATLALGYPNYMMKTEGKNCSILSKIWDIYSHWLYWSALIFRASVFIRATRGQSISLVARNVLFCAQYVVEDKCCYCYIFKIFYYLCSRFTSKVWNKTEFLLGRNLSTTFRPHTLYIQKLDSSLGNDPVFVTIVFRCIWCLSKAVIQ